MSDEPDGTVTDLQAPESWHVDERLESIERHLEALGIADDAVEGFVETWNLADEAEKERLYALGDVRIVDEIRHQVGHRDVFVHADELTGIEVELGAEAEISGDGTGTAAAELQEDTEALEVVEGTITQVEAWVGRDPEKARRALMAEMLMQDPRQSLLKSLEKLADF